jgi:hypothetical protein
MLEVEIRVEGVGCFQNGYNSDTEVRQGCRPIAGGRRIPPLLPVHGCWRRGYWWLPLCSWFCSNPPFTLLLAAGARLRAGPTRTRQVDVLHTAEDAAFVASAGIWQLTLRASTDKGTVPDPGSMGSGYSGSAAALGYSCPTAAIPRHPAAWHAFS